MTKFFVLAIPDEYCSLSSRESDFIKKHIFNEGFINLDKVFHELSLLGTEFSVEFIQYLLGSYFKIGLKFPDFKNAVVFFVLQLHFYLNLPIDVYKQFVTAQLLNYLVCDGLYDGDADNIAGIVRELYLQQFFTDDDVFKLVYFLSKYVIVKKDNLKALTVFVEIFQAMFNEKHYSPNDRDKIVEVGRILRAEMERESTEKSTKEKIKKVLNVLGVTDKVNNNKTSKSQQVHDSLKYLIEKIVNNEATTEKIALKNNKAEVEYLLKFVMKSKGKAIKFASILPMLFHDDPCSAYYFRSLLLSITASTFDKHHTRASTNNYSDENIKAMCWFVAELMCSNYFRNEDMNGFTSWISKEAFNSPKLVENIAIMKIVNDMRMKTGSKNPNKIDEVLNNYVTRYIEENIHLSACKGLWVPNDEEVKRRWIGILFDLCVKQYRKNDFGIPKMFFFVCNKIVSQKCSKFTHKDLSEEISDKIVEDFKIEVQNFTYDRGTLRHFKLKYLEELLNGFLLTKNVTVSMWEKLLQEVTKKIEILPSFIEFLNASCVRDVNYVEDIEKIKKVLKFLNSNLYSKEFGAIRPTIRNIIRLLTETVRDSYLKLDLSVENQDEADKSFVEAVDKIFNEGTFHGIDFTIFKTEACAKFYLENATKTRDSARVFGSLPRLIFKTEEKLKQFLEFLVPLLEKQLKKQHNSETKKEFSEQEILTTNHFVCELVLQKLFSLQKLEKFLKLLMSSSDSTSKSCIPLLNMALICIKANLSQENCLDDYGFRFAEYVFKNNIRQTMEFIPKDTRIKKKFIDFFYLFASKHSSQSLLVMIYCREITETNPTEFGEDQLKEYSAEKVIVLINDLFDEITATSSRTDFREMAEFFKVLVEKSMLTKKGIIKIWKAASEHLIDKWFTAQYLAAIIEKSSSVVDVLDDQESIDDIEAVRQALRPHLNNIKLKKIQKTLKQINRNLEALIENAKISESSHEHQTPNQLPPSSCQASTSKHAKLLSSCQPSTSKQANKPLIKETAKSSEDKYEKVLPSFKKLIEMLEKDEPTVLSFSLNDIRTDAEYYFERAIRDDNTVISFAIGILGICSENFNTELLNVIQDRFKKHHNPLTQKKFIPSEIKNTTLFIFTLLNCHELTMCIDHFINIIEIQTKITPISRMCLEMLKSSSTLSKPKSPKKNDELSNHPDVVYFESFLEQLGKHDSAYLSRYPKDPAIVDKWFDMLIEKGIDKRELFPFIVVFFNRIYEETKTSSSLTLKKTYEIKLLQKLDESFNNVEDESVIFKREEKFYMLLGDFFQKSLIPTTGILNFWKAFANNLAKNSISRTNSLIALILSSRDKIKAIEGKKQKEIIIDICENISIQKNRKLDSIYTENVLKAIDYLESLIRNFRYPKQNSRKPEESVIQLTPEHELQSFVTSNSDFNAHDFTKILEKFETHEKAFKSLVKTFMIKSMVKQDNTSQLLKQIDVYLKKNLKFKNEETFKTVLTSTIQNSFKKLPKFDQLSTEDEINQVEAAVKLTGELYFLGWIDQPKLISCMDKLSANNFGSDHQLRMFNDLLRTVESEMIRQKHIGKSKFYIDLLIMSESNKKVRNLKCIEILRRISTSNVKKNDEKTDEFDDLLNQVSDETLNDVAKEISVKFSTNTDERILSILEKFTAKFLESPKLFSKLVKASDLTLFTSFVLDQCQEDFLEMTHIDKIDTKLIDLVKFIGELYNEGLATGEFVKVCMDVLFGIETPCEVAVDSISALVRTVCVKMEISDKDKLDRYFKYFGYVISQKEESYISKVFEFLVALKNNGWKCDENAAKPLVDHHFNGLSEEEIPSILLKLQRLIDGSVEVGVAVIRKIWEIVIMEPELIKLCVDLTKELSNVELVQEDSKLKFCDLLTQFLAKRREAFMAIPDDQFNDKIKAHLGQVVMFITDLYVLKNFNEDLLISWLDEKLIETLSIQHSEEISKAIREFPEDLISLSLRLKLVFIEQKIEKEIKSLKIKLKTELHNAMMSIK